MQSKRSRIREGITFCLGLTMACGIGIYIGHTAGEEAKQLEEQRIHYVQEGETLWDIASGIASDSDDIRQVFMNYRQSTTFPAQMTCIPGNG
jgi:hypothetical protein